MASAGNAISAQHQGPAVNLAVWISLVVSSLAVLLKVTSKALRNQRSINFKNWGPDDYSIIAAVVCIHSRVQTPCIHFEGKIKWVQNLTAVRFSP